MNKGQIFIASVIALIAIMVLIRGTVQTQVIQQPSTLKEEMRNLENELIFASSLNQNQLSNLSIFIKSKWDADILYIVINESGSNIHITIGNFARGPVDINISTTSFHLENREIKEADLQVGSSQLPILYNKLSGNITLDLSSSKILFYDLKLRKGNEEMRSINSLRIK